VICATVPQHILVFFYSTTSAEFCLRNCQKVSRGFTQSIP